MSDLQSAARLEGDPECNRGHLIDPTSVDWIALGECKVGGNGKHFMVHSGNVDPSDPKSDPMVRCRYCGAYSAAKWKDPVP